MATLEFESTNEIDEKENVNKQIVGIPKPPIPRKYVAKTKPKESVIVVEDLTLVITQRLDDDPAIVFNVTMAPLDTGEIPEVRINKPITLSNIGFRKGDIVSCIVEEMTSQYPEKFISDPTVIINNFGTEVRKETTTFDVFKDDVLFTLQYTFGMETGV